MGLEYNAKVWFVGVVAQAFSQVTRLLACVTGKVAVVAPPYLVLLRPYPPLAPYKTLVEGPLVYVYVLLVVSVFLSFSYP